MVEAGNHRKVGGTQFVEAGFIPGRELLFLADFHQHAGLILQRRRFGTPLGEFGSVDAGIPRVLAGIGRMRERDGDIEEEGTIVAFLRFALQIIHRTLQTIPVQVDERIVAFPFPDIEGIKVGRVLCRVLVSHPSEFRIGIGDHFIVEVDSIVVFIAIRFFRPRRGDDVVTTHPDHFVTGFFHDTQNVRLVFALQEMHGPMSRGMRIKPRQEAAS